MSKRKLWACTLTHEIYVLSEEQPSDIEVERWIRDASMEPDVHVRKTKTNPLCWGKDEIVFGPDEDVTLEEALAEANS